MAPKDLAAGLRSPVCLKTLRVIISRARRASQQRELPEKSQLLTKYRFSVTQRGETSLSSYERISKEEKCHDLEITITKLLLPNYQIIITKSEIKEF
ncbi:hypothetical protein PUN28_001846 [Cardiocondyla obscurior]|uniref:Ribosomal protein S10 n=1 Tax=Cardiocondyla obscurior TaxID=286306 RepID=A0AAW2GRN7_9HYME